MTRPWASRGLTRLDVLALTLEHEAGGEGEDGMRAVGCVIRNRSSRRQRSIEAVCLAPAQFSCWSPAGGAANHARLVEHANLIRLGQTPTTMRDAYRIARAVLDGAPDVTDGADHYYAPAAMDPPGRVPTWAVDREPCAVIGGHRFFDLEGPSA